jgi:hypothetical protein
VCVCEREREGETDADKDMDADADSDSDTDTDRQTPRMIPDKVGHGRDGKCSSKQCNKLSTLCYT